MNRSDFVRRVAVASDRQALFPLGDVSITLLASRRLAALGLKPADLIVRHQAGDWGEIDQQDRAMNEQSLRERQRFFSSYEIEAERFWVLTAADRSSTVICLPVDPTPDTPPASPSPDEERANTPGSHPKQPGG